RLVIEFVMMLAMAIDRQTELGEVSQRRRPPVIGVHVRQQYGVNVVPRDAAAAHARSQLARRQAEVDQDAESVDVENARVPRAAAGKNMKLEGHGSVPVVTLWTCAEQVVFYADAKWHARRASYAGIWLSDPMRLETGPRDAVKHPRVPLSRH